MGIENQMDRLESTLLRIATALDKIAALADKALEKIKEEEEKK